MVYSALFLEDWLNNFIKIAIDHGYNSQFIHKLIEKFNSYFQNTQLSHFTNREKNLYSKNDWKIETIFNGFGNHLVSLSQQKRSVMKSLCKSIESSELRKIK